MYARTAVTSTSYWMGEFLPSRENGESAISLYDRERHRPLAFRYGFDAGVVLLSYTALALWHLGYPDQALKRGNEALALAQTLSHPFNLAFADLPSCFSTFCVNIGATPFRWTVLGLRLGFLFAGSFRS